MLSIIGIIALVYCALCYIGAIILRFYNSDWAPVWSLYPLAPVWFPLVFLMWLIER